MGNLAIDVHALGKRYWISGSHRHMRFDTLRESLVGFLPWGGRGADARGQPIWALKDITFQVTAGEVVGLIGHNGAGKSTLLKILSRITDPTEGFAEIDGRVGSLLEVGTGFHPELTGRENVYLNGAILGMRRADIARRFDEIVSFAETEAFLDTPIKKYSSGMYLRLAFAVAAHLEPDILIVDEVLAVGDAAFQRKCLGKMGDVAKAGRTVLFVSHNMGAVRSLCSRALVFNAGQVGFDGTAEGAIAHYLATAGSRAEGEGVVRFGPDGRFHGDIALHQIRLVDRSGQARGFFDAGDPISVEIEYEIKAHQRGLRTTLSIATQEGETAFASTDQESRPAEQAPGRYRTACTIPGELLNRRTYRVSVGFEIPGIRTIVPREEHLSFVVDGAGNQGSNYPERWPGVVCPALDWRTEPL